MESYRDMIKESCTYQEREAEQSRVGPQPRHYGVPDCSHGGGHGERLVCVLKTRPGTP